MFTAAYRQHSARVLGYLRSNGVEDPESVTHDVFLALYRVLDGVEGGADDVQTLTFSIAHARLVDHHRARARKPQVIENIADSDLRRSPSAEDLADQRLGERGVRRHVDRLSDEQRQAVLLRIVAGLSLEATAHVMGKSIGAVKQLQRRALEALRNAINGEPSDD